jgi:uncharacterized protein (TIGR00255 family)
MTGFGEASGENGRYGVTVGLRAVNHRFLDLQVRLPEEHRGIEGTLRERFARDLVRGRVEARIDIHAVRDAATRVHVNEEAVRAVAAAVRSLGEAGLVQGALTASDLLRLPAALQVEVDTGGWEEEDQGLLLRVAGAALEKLIGARAAEGGSLALLLLERVDKLSDLVAKLEGQRHEAREEIAAGLRKRLTRPCRCHSTIRAWLRRWRPWSTGRREREVDRLRSHPGTSGRWWRRGDRQAARLPDPGLPRAEHPGLLCRQAAMTRSVPTPR